MTREEFIKVLKEKEYSYELVKDRVVVTQEGWVNLNSLTSLPEGVEFKNKGSVYLYSLTSLPEGVEFKNEGNVDLSSLMGGYFHKWEGVIEGIDDRRLLNSMIKRGIFK